ncbi:MAG TPA: hypothetical protein VIY98_08495, partial [Nitrososphaeraceae archaeon]
IKPNVYSFTLPKISARRPKFKRIDAVTREYPITIHTIVKREAPSSDTMIGNAINIIFASREARSVPSVVFPNAIHLYEIFNGFLLVDEEEPEFTNQPVSRYKVFDIYSFPL